MNENNDSIVFNDDEKEAFSEVAHVDFDLLDTDGRWLLKVISGPNTGAEFSLQGGSSYIIGTDTQNCDIIFQDLSVSRQHAKITVDETDSLIIKDLGSRNGTYIDGEKREEQVIEGNVLISLGTTSFLLMDKGAERVTISAPTLYAQFQNKNIDTDSSSGESEKEPSSPSSEETDEDSESRKALDDIHKAVLGPLQSEIEKIKIEEEAKKEKLSQAKSSLSMLSIITLAILTVGVGTATLFRGEDIRTPTVVDPEKEISTSLAAFPAIRFSYNPANSRLLLIGHVLTSVDRSRMLDILQQLKFIRHVDYSNVVIDDLVYREINQILAKNPDWRTISVTSPDAGHYILNGVLKTKTQADRLYEYISQNFSYTDLLEKRVIVEEEILYEANQALHTAGFRTLLVMMNNGELTLQGAVSHTEKEKLSEVINSIKSIPGVRSLQVRIDQAGDSSAYIDLTTKYRTTGYSQKGTFVSVVINGRILSTGDTIDGMSITSITPSTVFLDKNGVKYKIDFNR